MAIGSDRMKVCEVCELQGTSDSRYRVGTVPYISSMALAECAPGENTSHPVHVWRASRMHAPLPCRLTSLWPPTACWASGHLWLPPPPRQLPACRAVHTYIHTYLYLDSHGSSPAQRDECAPLRVLAGSRAYATERVTSCQIDFALARTQAQALLLSVRREGKILFQNENLGCLWRRACWGCGHVRVGELFKSIGVPPNSALNQYEGFA
ncbi:hypothetical protein BGX38DRAFT_836816 [Terfezia claveryi]|nr:hypothetical protein BGX38DRAFT_836816 [Terfezia claveryi]